MAIQNRIKQLIKVSCDNKKSSRRLVCQSVIDHQLLTMPLKFKKPSAILVDFNDLIVRQPFAHMLAEYFEKEVSLVANPYFSIN